MNFILFSRHYCHLCHDFLAQLQSILDTREHTLKVIDIDEDSEYLSLYDELVPVLVAVDQDSKHTEICHYHFNESAFKDFLNGQAK